MLKILPKSILTDYTDLQLNYLQDNITRFFIKNSNSNFSKKSNSDISKILQNF